MNIEQAMNEIESLELCARVNIASGYRMFLQLIQEEESVRALLRELNSREHKALNRISEILQMVLNRISEILQKQNDPRYENPSDTALAIYLWVISLKDLSLAKAASAFVTQAPRCWWAAKVSHEVLSNEPFRSDSRTSDSRTVPIPQSSESFTPTVQAPSAVLPIRNYHWHTEKNEKAPIAA